MPLCSAESAIFPEIDVGASVFDEVSETIIVGARTGMMGAFDAHSGAVRWSHVSKPRLSVAGAALADVDGRRFVVLADRHGALKMFHVETGVPLERTMQAGEWLTSIATQMIDGDPLCFVATELDFIRKTWSLCF